MTSKEKIIEKLLTRPTSLKYKEIETLFSNSKYTISNRKGSHRKIELNKDNSLYIIIPLHNNDCLDTYKVKLKKFYILTNEYE